MTIKVKKTGDWARARRALDNRPRRAAISAGIGAELKYQHGKVQEAFASAGSSNGRPWPPNKSGGKPFEGSSIPKQLRINHPPNALTGYVYWPHGIKFRGAKRANTLRALIAHELGAVIAIPITRKMLQGMHAARREQGGGAGGGGGQKMQIGGTLIIRLPRRSSLVDTLEAHGGDKARDRLVLVMRSRLGPEWVAR